jgi:hypothetical protein
LRQDLALLAQFAQEPKAPDLDVYLKKEYGNTGRHSNKGKDDNTN